MPRIIAPLFGFKAHGSLANSLTYASSRKLNVAKTIPTHLDAQSLAQLRHRFLYRLGIALWNGMASGTRAGYAALAVGHNYSAMNVWLREWLTTFPDLDVAFSLFQDPGSTLLDASPNAWNLPLYGPSWVTVDSRPAILADGIDDYAQFATSTPLDYVTSHFTFLFRLTFHRLTNWDRILDKSSITTTGHMITVRANNNLRFATKSAGGITEQLSTANSLALETPYVICCTLDDTAALIVIDGVDRTGVPTVMTVPDSSALKATFFERPDFGGNFGNLTLDWFVAFSRSFTLAQAVELTRYFAD